METETHANDDGNFLVRSHVRFVFGVAHEYRNLGLPFEDLVGEGNVGLVEAARRFDPCRGTQFTTYAVWWIRKSIRKALSDHACIVRIPPQKTALLRRVRDAERRLASLLGRAPGRDEIGREVGVPIRRLEAVLQARTREVSLEDRLGTERDTPLVETLVDQRSANPEGRMIRVDYRRRIRWALMRLRECERAVLIGRYGLDGERELNLREIADRMGVSRERVRQIETLARKRLRRILAGLLRTPRPTGLAPDVPQRRSGLSIRLVESDPQLRAPTRLIGSSSPR